MRRRDFIAGAMAAWPLTSLAQQQTKPTVIFLTLGPGSPPPEQVEGFRRGLAQVGFSEGRDVTVEYLTADGHAERLPGLAADVVKRRPAAILALTDPSALAAKQATQSIPIIFAVSVDPVELGLVPSFNRPAGNLTGVVGLGADIVAKRLELLHKLVTVTETIAMLTGAADSPGNQAETRNAQSAARSLGLRLLLFNATTESEIAAAFATLVERQAGAVLLGFDVQLNSMTDQIISLAARYALPTMFFRGSAAREGGLSSYGTVLNEIYRQAGAYTGRIL